jgi:hypothetical protein
MVEFSTPSSTAGSAIFLVLGTVAVAFEEKADEPAADGVNVVWRE